MTILLLTIIFLLVLFIIWKDEKIGRKAEIISKSIEFKNSKYHYYFGIITHKDGRTIVDKMEVSYEAYNHFQKNDFVLFKR